MENHEHLIDIQGHLLLVESTEDEMVKEGILSHPYLFSQLYSAKKKEFAELGPSIVSRFNPHYLQAKEAY